MVWRCAGRLPAPRAAAGPRPGPGLGLVAHSQDAGALAGGAVRLGEPGSARPLARAPGRAREAMRVGLPRGLRLGHTRPGGARPGAVSCLSPLGSRGAAGEGLVPRTLPTDGPEQAV